MFCKVREFRLTYRWYCLFLLVSLGTPAFASRLSFVTQSKNSADDLAEFLSAQTARGAKTMALEVYDRRILKSQYYEPPFGPSTRAQMFSVTKSLTSLAIGAAVQRYSLDLGGSICEWFAQARENGLCAIKLVDVLQMSSGLRWKEDYSATSPESQVLEMLYGTGALAMARYVLAQPLAALPGSVFKYSSGDTMLLSAILDKVTDGQARPFVQREVLNKMGLANAIWEADRSGTLVGAASLYLSAPEMAQVGFAMLDGGVTSRGAVITPEFYRESLRPARPGVAYGYQWWLNDDGRSPGSAQEPQQPRRWPSATPRTFAALGHWGQYLVVIPEEELVIVRIGDDKTASFDLDGLIRIARGARNRVGPVEQVPGDAKVQRVQKAEIPPAMLEHALGFGAKTACSCVFVSLFPWEYCVQYLHLPDLPALEYRRSVFASDLQGDHPTVEARWNGSAKAAVFQEGEGCVLMNDQSYKVEGLSGLTTRPSL